MTTGPLQHPAWCDVAQCGTTDGDRFHFSRALNIPATPGLRETARLIFVLYGNTIGRPLVEMTVMPEGANAAAPTIVTDVDDQQLQTLHAALDGLLHVVTAGEPHRTELPAINTTKGGAQS